MIRYEELREPFPASDIQWRVQSAGISNKKPWALVLAYVDSRAIQERLDEVFGVDGWWDSYEHKENGVECSLSFRNDRGDIITKKDGSPETNIEAFKGGYSKSLVRTASKIGIGRYLYNLKEGFAECSLERKPGWRKQWDKKTNTNFYWKEPSLPLWALPFLETLKTMIDRAKKEDANSLMDFMKSKGLNNIHEVEILTTSEQRKLFHELKEHF